MKASCLLIQDINHQSDGSTIYSAQMQCVELQTFTQVDARADGWRSMDIKISIRSNEASE